MISEGVLTSIIGLIGGVLVAYISVRVRRKKPKSEYIDTAFEAYESIMKRQDEENARLREINNIQAIKIDECRRGK